MAWVLLKGDCLDVMRSFPFGGRESYDAMITDPPAGIEFCGEAWDSARGGRTAWIDWLAERLSAALDLVKPGGYGVIWSFPRTSHWTGTALEDAGWEIRDKAYHLFATGMGRGNNLKPMVEEWWIVRKPFKGSAKANMERHGVGVMNLDACRVPRDKENDVPGWHKSGAHGSDGFAGTDSFKIRDMSAEEIQERCGAKDRFPPNLSLGEGGALYLESQKNGLSRYFPDLHDPVCYCPKPSRAEKEFGLEAAGVPLKTMRRLNPGGLSNDPRFAPIEVRNDHKTVKPVKLMEWFIRLVLPTLDDSRFVVDPFAGSGTTGMACMRQGVSFFGIEQDPESYRIAGARIEATLREEETKLFREAGA